jgi:trk system potassium uptake protein TrkA
LKVIIVGGGEVGFHIAQRLSEENQDVVLIDQNPEQIKRVADNLDVQAFLGSGTSPKILKTAGISDADILLATTDSDEVNLVSCLIAKNLNPSLIKVARLRNEEYVQELPLLLDKDHLGIDHVINPQAEMVRSIQRLMEIPGASEVIDFVEGRVKLIGVMVDKKSPFAGRKLLSFTKAEGEILVGAIVRNRPNLPGQVIIPHGNDSILAGDLVYLVARTRDLDKNLGLFGIKEKSLKRVVIIGAGQTGEALAREMDRAKVNTKIIEKDKAICGRLSASLNHVIVINGDGTDKDLLEEENIAGADFVVAITGDEESNILISLLAKELGTPKAITRVSKLSYLPLMSAIGIQLVVSPRLSAVRAILQYIRPGKILSVAPLKGEHAEAIEAEALDTSDIVNKPLHKVKIPKGVIIGAIFRKDEIIIPRGNTVIKPGDRLIIFALLHMLPKLEKLLTVKLEYF